MLIMRLPLDHPLTRFALAGTLAASLAGCAPSLTGVNTGTDTQTNTDTQNGTGTQTETSRVTTTTGNGVSSTVVDATRADAWTYVSLATGKEVSPATPESDNTWDIAFQASTIKTNGGIHGNAGGSAARLENTDFDSLTTAPTSGYATDAADSEDSGTAPDTAFLVNGGWYSYNTTTHVITPKDVVFVVHAANGKYYKVKITNYYDAAGTPRFISYKSAEIASPFSSASVEAPTTGVYVYLSLRTGQIVSPADPATSLDWDLAFSRTSVLTNSGESGSGQGGALLSEAASLLNLAAIPSDPVTTDTATDSVSSNALLKDWYDYSGAPTHLITPKARIYVIKTADGRYAKLRFVKYENRTTTVEWFTAASDATTF